MKQLTMTTCAAARLGWVVGCGVWLCLGPVASLVAGGDSELEGTEVRPQDTSAGPGRVPLGVNRPPLAGASASGFALEFDGVDDVLAIADSSTLDFGAGDFTVEAWIFVDPGRTEASREYGVANKNTTYQQSPGWGFEISTHGVFPNYTAKFYLTSQSAWCSTCAASTALTPGRWYHLAGVRTGAQTSLYVNGNLAASTSLASAPLNVDNNQPLLIGRHSWGPAFPGTIDEVRVWRAARSEAELRAGLAVRLTGGEANLAGDWNLEEGSGGQTVDRTPNGQTGVLGAGVPGSVPVWTAGVSEFSSWNTTSSVMQILLTLTGFDPDGDPLEAVVTALPASGRLYQTTDGVTRGARLEQVPAPVADAGRRLLYVPRRGVSAFDTVEYQLSDGSLTSSPGFGFVTVVGDPAFDTDGDGMPDGFEMAGGLDPENDDTRLDPDADGLDNLGEYQAGASPGVPDTDHDGLEDGAEVAAGTNPVARDSDGDGLPDWSDPQPTTVVPGLTFTAAATVTVAEGAVVLHPIKIESADAPIVYVDYAPGGSLPAFVSTGPMQIVNTATGGTAELQLCLAPLADAAGTYPVTVRAAAKDGKSGSFALTVTVTDTPALVVTRWKDPVDGNWNDASKWTAGVPGAGQVAVIDAGSAAPFTIGLNAPMNAAGLVLDDPNATLSVDQDNTFTAPVEVRRGRLALGSHRSLAANGPIVVTGTFELFGREVSTFLGGSAWLENRGLLRASAIGGGGGAAQVYLPVRVPGGGRLVVGRSAYLNLRSGSLLGVAGTVEVESEGWLWLANEAPARDLVALAGAELSGAGTLQVQGGNRLYLMGETVCSLKLELADSAQALGEGWLRLPSDQALARQFGCPVVIHRGATVWANHVTFTNVVQVEPAATLAVGNNRSLTLNGVLTNLGILRMSSRDEWTEINGSGRVENAGVMAVGAQGIGGYQAGVRLPVNVAASAQLLVRTNAHLNFRASSSLTSAGTVEVQTGALLLFENENPARVFTVEAGCRLLGEGILRFNGGNRLVMNGESAIQVKLELRDSSRVGGTAVLTVAGDQTLTGVYDAPVTLAAGANVTVDNATFNGLVTVPAGATLIVANHRSLTLNGVLTNLGTLQMNSRDAGTEINGSGRIENAGLLAVNAQGTGGYQALVQLPVNVVAAAQLLLRPNAHLNFRASSSLTAAGTVEVQTGALLLFENENPARVFTVEAGCRLLGEGILRFNGGNRLVMNGESAIQVKLELRDSSRVEGTAALLVVGNQTFTGTYNGPVTLTAGANVTVDNATFNGPVTVPAGATLMVANSRALTLNGVLTNLGTLRMNSRDVATEIKGGGRVENAGLLAVDAQGTGGYQALVRLPVNVVAAAQLLLRPNAHLNFRASSSLTAAGTVEVQTGALLLFENENPARVFTVEADCRLLGEGILRFNGGNRLVMNAAATVESKLQLRDSSRVGGTAVLTVAGDQTLTGVYDAPVTLAVGASVTVDNATFNGPVTVPAGATLMVANSRALTLNGVLTNLGTLRMNSRDVATEINGGGRVENAGLLAVDAQGLGGYQALVQLPVNVAASAQLLVRTNAHLNFRASSSLTAAGTVEVQTGALLLFENETPPRDFTLEGGALLTGGGTIELRGSNRLVLQGDSSLAGGTLRLVDSSTIAGKAGLAIEEGAQLYLNHAITVPGPVALAGTLTLAGAGTTLAVHGQLTLGAAGVLNNPGMVKVRAFVDEGGTINGNPPIVDPSLGLQFVRIDGIVVGGGTIPEVVLTWLAQPGVAFTVEVSVDLIGWQPVGTQAAEPAPGVYRAQFERPPESLGFFRLRGR